MSVDCSMNNCGIFGAYFNKHLIEQTSMEKPIELSALDHVESFMGDFERGLDDAGVIPVVGTGSGLLRIGYGLVQTITALSFKVISGIAKQFCGDEDKDFWEKWDNRAFYHIKNGLMNMGRGIIESIPGVNFIAFFDLWSDRTTLVHSENGKRTHNKCQGLLVEPFKHVIISSTEEMWCNRYYYEGELKKMHLEAQMLANQGTNF
jgi:hypothetical protein